MPPPLPSRLCAQPLNSNQPTHNSTPLALVEAQQARMGEGRARRHAPAVDTKNGAAAAWALPSPPSGADVAAAGTEVGVVVGVAGAAGVRCAVGVRPLGVLAVRVGDPRDAISAVTPERLLVLPLPAPLRGDGAAASTKSWGRTRVCNGVRGFGGEET
jgi:hypothetical protein